MGLFGKKKEVGPVPPMQGMPDMGQVPPQSYAYMPEMNPPQAPPDQYTASQPQPMPQPEVSPGMEETVEAIIDEKWNDILKDINKIIEWKERTDSVINRLQQEVEDLRNGMESLHQSMMAKISTYDQNIKNVGVDIKAMEQVFQRILPKFTDNVNKLSRITERVSRK